MLKLVNRLAYTSFCLLLGILNVLQADTDQPDLPPHKKTKAGLYLSSKAAHERMKADEKIILLDVRTPEEWQAGHAKQAKFVPLKFRGENGMTENPDFLKDAKKLVSKDQTIFMMCRSGVRSATATNALYDAGYKKIYSVYDGFVGWQKAGLPTEKPKKK